MMLSMDNFLFIPKRIVDRTGKPLSLPAIVELELENVNSTAEFDGRGLSLLENTPLEIEKAVHEMELRATGVWCDDARDQDMQRRFFDLLPDYLKVGAGGGTISTSYLRDNTWFLE
jgi:putative glycosyltransferase (TIGR04372 family)